jgi:hypothetical protein
LVKKFLILSMLLALIVSVFIGISQVNATTYTPKIAFESTRSGQQGSNNWNDKEIYIMNPNGSGSIDRLTQNTAYDGMPDWSPDGAKIAFVSERDGNSEIYVMESDGSNPMRLTSATANDIAPAWSPSGDKIAFQSDATGTYQIYIMEANGSNCAQLTVYGGCNPSWSPDGSKIAFEANDEIYTMDSINGGNLQRLTNNTCWDNYPVWSPDGQKILFTSFQDGNTEIYVMNADGSQQINLSQSQDTDNHPSWSPDGAKIVFETYRDGNYELYTMNPDGTLQTRVTMCTYYDEAPDWGNMTEPSPTPTPPPSGTWSTCAPMQYARAWFDAATTGNKIYAMGGYPGGGSMEVLDLNASPLSWTLTNMTYTFDNAACAYADKVYSAGGADFGLNVYNTTLNQWETNNITWFNYVAPGMAAVNGNLYLFGGVVFDATLNTLNTIYKYELNGNPGYPTASWQLLSNQNQIMPQPRYCCKALVYNNLIYIVGGGSNRPYYPNDMATTIDVFDTTTDTIIGSIPLISSAQRIAPGAAVINGKIYIFGGIAGSTVVSDVDIYDIGTQQWSKGTPWASPRYSEASVTINGQVYLIGGIDTYGSALNQVDIYTP